jgi:hypothetical protein
MSWRYFSKVDASAIFSQYFLVRKPAPPLLMQDGSALFICRGADSAIFFWDADSSAIFS